MVRSVPGKTRVRTMLQSTITLNFLRLQLSSCYFFGLEIPSSSAPQIKSKDRFSITSNAVNVINP